MFFILLSHVLHLFRQLGNPSLSSSSLFFISNVLRLSSGFVLAFSSFFSSLKGAQPRESFPRAL